ncbi:MAG: hypothetical protein ACJAQ6_000046 [Arenicella sp.]|jgi:hypothetical protein
MKQAPSPQVLIGTPAYNGMLHTDYLHSILGFVKNDIPHAVMTIGNESLITRARNTILASFWEADTFTHLLFLDADVFLDHQGLSQMLSHNKDVVGAPVYLKGKNADGEQTANTDAKLNVLPVLQSVTRVGTAALLLSRSAVNSLVAHAIKQDRTYSINKMLRHEGMATTHYDVFRVGISNDEYLSEDFWLCKELRELGHEIHVDTSVYTRHNGMVCFD